MYKYYIINTRMARPLSTIDSAGNSKALEFESVQDAREYIEKNDIPRKKELQIMTWEEFLNYTKQL